MNPQPDPSHGVSGPGTTGSQAPAAGENSESRARLQADAVHEREVGKNMLFTTIMGLTAVITAILTTVLDLTIFWRNLWLTVCIVFAVLMFAGIFQFCGHIDSSTEAKITRH
jgi:hypothetical protein